MPNPITYYIVSFEPGAGEGIENVVARLKTFGNYCPINKYCWVVGCDKTPSDLVTYLAEGSANLHIFVVRSGTSAAWLNSYGVKHDEWLKKYL